MKPLELTIEEMAEVNTAIKQARESLDWQDFFADVGSHPVIPERSTGGQYYTVEEMYRFFKERMQFEIKSLQTR